MGYKSLLPMQIVNTWVICWDANVNFWILRISNYFSTNGKIYFIFYTQAEDTKYKKEQNTNGFLIYSTMIGGSYFLFCL